VSRYVIDASAATEYLLRTPLGLKLADAIEGAFLLAPELLDVEVLSVLRRAVLRGELTEQRALVAIEDLIGWSIDRIPHISLVRTAWQHRHNVSAYDAFYVTAARLSRAPLLTADGPLARAPALGIVVENIRLLSRSR
jgi:predicted nucleic acid-binding protein